MSVQVTIPFNLGILDRLEQVKHLSRQAGAEMAVLDKEMAKGAGKAPDQALIKKYRELEESKGRADKIIQEDREFRRGFRDARETRHVMESLKAVMVGVRQ